MAKNKDVLNERTSPDKISDRYSLLDLSRFIRASEEDHNRQAELDAYVPEGIGPLWHVIEVRAGMEFKVRDTLAERRFGVFFPTYRVWEKNRFGVERMKIRKLITRYMFVWVFGIEQHWSRITSVEGVVQILKDGNEAAIIPWEMINHLRILEVYVEEKIELAGAKKKRKRRKKKRHVEDLEGSITVQSVCWSRRGQEWHSNAETVDDENRRTVFERALGLAS